MCYCFEAVTLSSACCLLPGSSSVHKLMTLQWALFQQIFNLLHHNITTSISRVLFVCFSDFFWTKLFVLFSKGINLKHVFTSQTYRYLSLCWWVTFNFPTHILRICVCVEIKLNDWFVSLISCSTVQKTRVCWLQDFIYDARFVATSCSVAMQKCKTCKISKTVSHWSKKIDLQIFLKSK